MSLVAQLVLVGGPAAGRVFRPGLAAHRTRAARLRAPARRDARWHAPRVRANFFDTLGIGSFASTTAWIKFRNLIRDELIPGTLNVGHALPTITQAIIFTTAIAVAPLPWWRWSAPRWRAATWARASSLACRGAAVQLGMGIALLVAAALFVMKIVGLLPAGGNALGLSGGVLVFAVVVNFASVR